MKFSTSKCILVFSLLSFSVYAEPVKEFRLRKKAQTFSGQFQGIKVKKKRVSYDVSECTFTHERGSDIHPKNDREYSFERFTVNYLGKDKNGDLGFDSISYGYSDYTESFKVFDYGSSFSQSELKNILEEGREEKAPSKSMYFEKGEGLSAKISFGHKEEFSSSETSFFDKGEKGEFELVVDFVEFSEKSKEVNSIAIKVNRTKGSQESEAALINCSAFEIDEDE